MDKTTLYLPEEMSVELRQAARRNGTSQAEIVRAALGAYLRATPRRLPRSVGVAGNPNVSAARDEEALDAGWDRKLRRR